MAEPINIDGVLYEDLGNGQMRVVGYADTPASRQGRVFTLPQSSKDARQEARQNEADRRADDAGRRADRQLQLAEEAAARAARAAALGEGGTAKQRADWRGNLANINLLDQTVKDLRERYERDFKGKGLQSVAEAFAPEYLSPEYGVFDQKGQTMLGDMAKAKGLTSQQFNTPAEQRMFFEPLIPKRGDTDEKIESKLTDLERMIQAGRATTEQNLKLFDQEAGDDTPDPAAAAGSIPPNSDRMDVTAAIDGPRSEGQTTVASGKTRTVRDARLSGQIDALVNAGAWGVANETLRKNGFPPITPAEKLAIEKWKRANPGKKYFGADVSRDEDLSLPQRVAGSDTGAFLAHMGNMGSAGLAGALAGPTGQGALDAMAANSPNASFAGGLIGGATGALGLEAVAAARAPAAVARFAPRFADAAYGGALGFNQAREGEGLSGALWGAGTTALGGAAGQRVVSGLGRAARGVTDPTVQYLRSLDIPLTVGQTVGGSGLIGRGVKKVEDALTSLPFVGNMVDARRMEGIRDFNRAAFDTAGSQVAGDGITETGAEGIQQLRVLVGRSYRDALDPVRIDASDPAFIADLAGANASAARIPDVNGARGAADAALDARISGAIEPVSGLIPGRNFQEAYRGLARTGRERANGDYGHEIGQVMRQGQDALAGALERQNPGAFGAFRAANATNRNANVLAEAVNKAKNAEDELFTPAQLNMADAASARRLTGPLASAAGERPFHELATAGQAVLPSKLPDSGTWTRALVGGGATGVLGTGGYAIGGGEGATTGAATGLGATLLLAAGGSRPAQRALVSIFADRPDLARKFGDILIDNAGAGGGIGAGTSAALITAP